MRRFFEIFRLWLAHGMVFSLVMGMCLGGLPHQFDGGQLLAISIMALLATIPYWDEVNRG